MQIQHSVLKKIDSNIILITPNNRLAQELIQQYYSLEEVSVPKPRIFSYHAFLIHLFHLIRHQKPSDQHPILLTPAITRQIWLNIILQTQPSCNTGLLDAALSSWRLEHEWQISYDSNTYLLPQHRLFQHWKNKVEKKILSMNAIAEEQLPQWIQQYFPLQLANECIWYCFDAFTPNQQQLKTALGALQIRQVESDLPLSSPHISVVETKDTEEEYQQLIQWIQVKRQEQKKRIGIVIPDLQTEANPLMRRLTQSFSPAEINISLGKSLAHYPIIAHAMTWLTLESSSLNPHQVRLLFTSPYLLKSNLEGTARWEWLQNTSLAQKPQVSLKQIVDHLPSTIGYLKEILTQWIDYPAEAKLHEWIQYFERRLIHLGFPGETNLTSYNYQCYQRFIHIFDEFREFECLTPKLTQSAALDLLTDLIQQTLFQPKTHTAPIQVLGLLEASGCTFDCMWIAHLTDQQFPQKGNLSAFIPIELQRTLDMPHANIEREIKFSQQIFRRLTHASTECILSYSRLNADMPCMPSPFLNSIQRVIFPLITEIDQTALISYEESYFVPFQETHTTGGTSLLSNQAKCPFRAFAAHRLHLRQEEDISLGLTPQEKGQMVHLILEKLWAHIQTQERLLAYPSQDLLEQIKHFIREAFISMKVIELPELIQTVEFQRLLTLIQACLEWEKTRSSFTVAALEKATTIELAGITFHIKLDRIDQLTNGDHWVIDYKSRLPTQKPWSDERPEEPQILLYALAETNVSGLLFLALRHGQVNCCGFSAEGTHITGINSPKDPWSHHFQQWTRILNQLAEEFKLGQCIPKPTRVSICQGCEYSSICRANY